MMQERKIPITTRGRELSPWVADELATQALRIKPRVSAEHLWTRVLTEEDRLRLGGDFENCYPRLGTAGMWMELRGVSEERAVIEVARKLRFLDEESANQLLREIGEEAPAPPVPEHPVWHPEKGELCWGDQVIRRVRIMARPSSIQTILDAFQAAEWPPRIADPITQGRKAHEVRQIVFYLNEGLELIRFHVQESGRAITWTRS